MLVGKLAYLWPGWEIRFALCERFLPNKGDLNANHRHRRQGGFRGLLCGTFNTNQTVSDDSDFVDEVCHISSVRKPSNPHPQPPPFPSCPSPFELRYFGRTNVTS
ncbi:hypothetical protein HOLleu_17577 [Holothuria leucospilota]|uniref:Uncharacterized protein n=1 Tax=Holothuria leucospilota TaxID=206669 RepID=A0A9Q1H634_HOLLE|nr:hypothetical protein HOLleu_17577 [Holothuria leucospilota]